MDSSMSNEAIEKEEAKITRIMRPHTPIIIAEAVPDDDHGILYSISATTDYLRVIGCGYTLQEAFDDLLACLQAES
jgi:hypothetical protein